MILTPEQSADRPAQFHEGAGRRAGARRTGCPAADATRFAAAPSASGSSASAAKAACCWAKVDPAFGTRPRDGRHQPGQLAKADEVLAKAELPAAKHYAEWRDMVAHEDIEAVIIAVPLWAHADVIAAASQPASTSSARR